MSGLNNLPLNGAVINLTGVAQSAVQQSGLLSHLEGQPSRVQLIGKRGLILQFDACLQENHQYSSTPTAFPVEDGSIISDHVILNPVTLTLTGVVSDNPLPESLGSQLKQVFGGAATSLLPPLGVTFAATAYAIYQLGSQQVQPSKRAYQTLCSLRTGNTQATPPTPPEPFSVVTRYARFENMVLTDLVFPVDASTDGQCVFTVTLAKLVIVAPQKVSLSSLSNAALAAAAQHVGEQTDEDDYFSRIAKKNFMAGRQSVGGVGL